MPMEDTHSMYRIGTDYNKIIQNATAFINAGGTAEWCFIKFKHNEHQVEEARSIAEQMGFSLFVEKNSFKLHLNRIYILREGLDTDVPHTLSVRISEKRNALSKGNNCRIVYFGLNGDHRTPKGVDVDGIYFDGSNGTGPEK